MAAVSGGTKLIIGLAGASTVACAGTLFTHNLLANTMDPTGPQGPAPKPSEGDEDGGAEKTKQATVEAGPSTGGTSGEERKAVETSESPVVPAQPVAPAETSTSVESTQTQPKPEDRQWQSYRPSGKVWIWFPSSFPIFFF